MSASDIEDLYERYGGVMHFTMFLQGILSVDKKVFENVKYGRHHETLVHIRERLNEDEIKELKQLLSNGLSDREISTEMGIPLVLLRTTIKLLSDSDELTEEKMLYEKYKLLRKEGKKSKEVAAILKISEEQEKQLSERYDSERKEEEEKAREEKRAARAKKKEVENFEKSEKRAKRILDDYKYTEKNVQSVREYIGLCEEKFLKAQDKKTVFSDDELLFLAACMEFVECDYKEIAMFSKICIAMEKYHFARTFIMENMNNSTIYKQQREILMTLQKNIQYAIKKQNVLNMIEDGTEDISVIAAKTGVSRKDIINIQNGVIDNRLFLGNSIKRAQEDSIAI